MAPEAYGNQVSISWYYKTSIHQIISYLSTKIIYTLIKDIVDPEIK